MNMLKDWVEYGVLGLLLVLSIWAVAIGIARFFTTGGSMSLPGSSAWNWKPTSPPA